jgi:CHAT domain-containing protein
MSPCIAFGRARPRLRILFWPYWTAGLLGMAGVAGAAQAPVPSRAVPTAAYHAAFVDFNDGEYKTALERFQIEGRTAIKAGTARWIDSICYETMCGECYYQMGIFDKALEHYTSALELYLAYPNWMVSVNFAPIWPQIPPRAPPPWATRPPQARLGRIDTTMLIGQGQLQITTSGQAPASGAIAPPVLFPIEPAEIVRTTALAIRRRAQLLGPLAAHDPLFENLIVALSRRPGPPNHWSEAWINLELGLALAAGGRDAQAVAALQRATIAAGEFLHPLSSVAYLELGRLAVARGDYGVAAQCFQDASCAAYYYYDPNNPDLSADVMEEAFRYGAMVHLMANGKGMFAPLAPASQWARAARLPQLRVSLLLSAAENYAMLAQTVPAAQAVEEARMAIGRHQMANGRIGARRNFLAALVLFQEKKVPEGETLLAAAMNFMRQGSLWLFHLSLVDNFYLSGKGGAGGLRDAFDLFNFVLRDPLPGDWMADPMESLSVLMTPHPLCYEHWFDTAMARRNHEAAIEIADRARRHRFLVTLPLGGRIESLRWVLEGPKEMLTHLALLQRQELLTRFPEYDQLRQQAEQLHNKLAALPLAPEDADTLRQQTQAMKLLAAVAVRQQTLLYEMSVRREPAELAFPPLRSTADIRKSLPPGHALLVFFATSKAMHGFLLTRDRYCDWPLASTPQLLSRQTVALLREMGNYQQNHELTLKDIADTKWKTSARDLLDSLLQGSRADFSTKFDELVVVPDGVLWYLPFEALQVSVGGQLQPLISRFRIRYVPTASLATSLPGWGHRRGNTAVVVGHMYPKLDESVTQAAFAQLSKSIPGCVALHTPLPGSPALFSSLLDRLVVLDDLSVAPEHAPYGWTPLPLDRGKPGGTLADWIAMPWSGPEEIILPGFHTAAEDALKRSGRVAPGYELFLTACGLMADGARTVLLSRWRTGGQTSLDLVDEFVQELPHTTPADAWQRAVLVVATSSRLNVEAEPRIKRAVVDEPPRANHPFFWAGYLLLDGGVEPPEALPAKPAPAKPAAAIKLAPAKPAAAPLAPAKPEAAKPEPALAKPAL